MPARCSALLRGSPPLARRRTLTTLPSSYTRAGADDVAFFRGVCGAGHVLTPSDAGADLSKYNVDWMRQYRGSTAAVVRPRDTAGVSAILAHCSARRIPVVPQGGNTGLVGGGVPLSHEVVLSLERLRDVHSFDEDSGVVVCGGGLVLQALDEALGARGWMVPLDLGSKGSCAVGGNVATNAGGLRLLRYGSLHGSVLGVEAVTGNGTVLDALCTLRKDNVGFDVKQLFIGSEGALGVVTKVAMQAVQRPAALNVAVLGAASFADCRSLLRLARRRLGEVLSAAEFVDGAAMRILLAQLAGTRLPFSAPAPFFFFVELSGSNEAHDAEKLAGFLEEATAEGLALDGTVAADGAQTRSIWRLREDVSVACSQRGHVYKYDVSLPPARMYALVEEARTRLEGLGWDPARVVPVGYGHLGDNNLHLNISTPDRGQDYHARLQADIEPWVYEWVMGAGGSISAEHGLGQQKAKLLHRARPQPVVQLMKDLKKLLDPSGILNPGKVIPFE